MGLELDHVPGLRRLDEAERDGIERAAEVAAVRLDPPLPAGLGIDLEHGRADAPQVAHEPRLLELAGLEEPQDAAGEARRRRPAEVVPERALAGLADLRGAEMRAEAGRRRRPRRRRRSRRASARGFGQRGHQPRPRRPCARCATSSTRRPGGVVVVRARTTAMMRSFSRSFVRAARPCARASSARSRSRWRSAVLARWNQSGSIGVRLAWRFRSAAAIWVRIAAMASSIAISRARASARVAGCRSGVRTREGRVDVVEVDHGSARSGSLVGQAPGRAARAVRVLGSGRALPGSGGEAAGGRRRPGGLRRRRPAPAPAAAACAPAPRSSGR